MRQKKSLVLLLGMLYLVGGLCGVAAFIFVPLSLVLNLALGGSAVSGYQQGEGYFLVQHGQATQVSQTVFTWIRFVERVAISSIAPFMLTAVLMLLDRTLGWKRKIAGWSQAA
jgi:hypothetical protein